MPHCPRHFCRCWYQHVCCPHLVFFFQVHVNRCLSLPVIYLNLCGACVFPTAPQQFKVAGSLLHPRLKRNWVASCGKASVCLVFPDFSKFCARVPLSSFQAPTHPPSMTLGSSQPCPTRCVDARVGICPQAVPAALAICGTSRGSALSLPNPESFFPWPALQNFKNICFSLSNRTSLCSPDCLGTHKSSCLCLSRAGVKGVLFHTKLLKNLCVLFVSLSIEARQDLC